MFNKDQNVICLQIYRLSSELDYIISKKNVSFTALVANEFPFVMDVRNKENQISRTLYLNRSNVFTNTSCFEINEGNQILFVQTHSHGWIEQSIIVLFVIDDGVVRNLIFDDNDKIDKTTTEGRPTPGLDWKSSLGLYAKDPTATKYHGRSCISTQLPC